MRRLDAEARVTLHQRLEVPHFILMPDEADELRHGNAAFLRDLLGQKLVVHERVQVSRVVPADVEAVALVHAHYADGGKLPG